jgi:hypothetical protein
MFSVQSSLVSISWKTLTKFNCFPVHGLKHPSWLIWSMLYLVPSWKSVAWTCISYKFIYAKQSDEGMGSLAQLLSPECCLILYLQAVCSCVHFLIVCSMNFFSSGQTASPTMFLIFHLSFINVYIVDGLNQYFLVISHSSVTFRTVFLLCRENCLHFFFSCILPHTKTNVRNETIPVTIKDKKIYCM